MPTDTRRTRDRAAKRSRLFQASPDKLKVEEWVPSIALPEPPPAPLEDSPGEPALDEFGLPELPGEEPEEDVRAGPARLYVGQGRRSAPSGGPAPVDTPTVGYFMAELRLPKPEDGLPSRQRAAAEDPPDPWNEELVLDGAEPSDPDIADPDSSESFTLEMDDFEAPDQPRLPDPTPASAPPSVALGPSAAREPLAERVYPPPPTQPLIPKPPTPQQQAEHDTSPPPVVKERPSHTAVIRSKPMWTRARPLPAPPPTAAPTFQARDETASERWLRRLVSWPTLLALLAVLVAATVMLVRSY